MGWGGGVVAHKVLVSAQGPRFCVFGFGAKGLGPGLDNMSNNLTEDDFVHHV